LFFQVPKKILQKKFHAPFLLTPLNQSFTVKLNHKPEKEGAIFSQRVVRVVVDNHKVATFFVLDVLGGGGYRVWTPVVVATSTAYSVGYRWKILKV
jgi:hypothetical protein